MYSLNKADILKLIPNLLAITSLYYFDSLSPETRDNYILLSQEMITHYTTEDIFPTWVKLINRRQKPQETMIHFFDEFIRLSTTLHLSESLLIINFIDNILEPMELHIKLLLKQTHSIH